MNFGEAIRLIITDYTFTLQLITSAISGVSCALIGCFIILRRMALIGDALAHAILPGVVVAYMIAGTGPIGLFLGAMAAGILTSLTIAFVQGNSRIKEDSSIGIAFTFFFAIGIILASNLPKGSHFDLQCFLFGEIMGIEPDDFKMMLAVGIFVCLAVILCYRPLAISTFDPVMAACVGISVSAVHYFLMVVLSATVVSSIQTVGVIMVVAMLITPGATAYQLTDRLPVMLLLSALFGALSAAGGFVMAFMYNWPVGPSMTVLAGVFFFTAMMVSPRYGVLFNHYRRRQTQRHILAEDILKSVARNYPDSLPFEKLRQYLGVRAGRLKRTLRALYRKNMLREEGGLVLTRDGKFFADEILRTHRLWEKYLVEGGMAVEHAHHVAEALEHAHEMAETLNEKLGNPETDPHGQKIPQKGRTGEL